MVGSSILVLTAHRQTRRQVARALRAGGIDIRPVEHAAAVATAYAERRPEMIILDCDNTTTEAIEEILAWVNGVPDPPPVVLLSVGADKGPLLELVQRHDIGNLVAKHGAIRAVYPVLDERELLVTCSKVIQREIFGIEKYVGSWGVVLHHAQVTSVNDKLPFLTTFESYLNELDCPQSVVPAIVTVAEELILNAVVHAPRLADGTAKYESLGPRSDLVLEPHEYVDVVYGCDGQRLMLSVSDNFGKLNRNTLYNYLARGFDQAQIEAESKPGGAGLGLSLSFRSIHQLIVNVQDSVRTEVIAGWYLRVSTASEFRQVGKSLNLFWLPHDSQPHVQRRQVARAVVRLSGRIDESVNLQAAAEATELDLSEVNGISSHGLLHWLKFVRSVADRQIAIRGCPEALVRLATEVSGVLHGMQVLTVLVPYECTQCGYEKTFETAVAEALKPIDARCATCGGKMRFVGAPEQYRAFHRQQRIATAI